MGDNGEERRPLDALSILVFEQAAEGMVISRPADGVILEANDAWCALMGWERREVLGRSALELGLWADPAERSDTLERIRQGVGADGVVIAFRRKDGTVRIGEAKARSIEIDGQELMVGSIRDITERTVVEQELERSRADLAKAQELAGVGSWMWDLTTDEVVWSDQMYRLFFYDPDTFSGSARDAFARTHSDDAERIAEITERGIREGRCFPTEYRLLGPEGQVRWVFADGIVITDDAGRPIRMMGTTQDITERKLAEEERRRLLSELMSVREEERQRIAADIHDDSLQSLTATLLQVQLLLEHEHEPEPTERLDRIERALTEAISRLRHLIHELRPPALDRVGLAAAVQDLSGQVFEDTDVRVDVHDRVNRDVPSDVRMVAYRIFQEVLANVRFHAQARSVHVLLEIPDDQLHAVVRDDGVGIDPHLRDSSTVHLGLSSMHQRAELEGGRLEIGPAEGGGTVVEFWLPLHAHSAD